LVLIAVYICAAVGRLTPDDVIEISDHIKAQV